MSGIPSVSFAQFLTQLQIAKWNAIIPKCAMHVEEDGSSIKYLHPTKGWRWVRKSRIEIAA